MKQLTSSVGKRLVRELRSSRAGNGRRHAMVKHRDIVAEAEVSDVDRVGLASHRITVRRESINGHNPNELLKGQVVAINERLRYLPEPLAAVELDEHCQGATLRSSPPTEDEDGRRFFELRLSEGKEVHVTRWFTRAQSNWRQPEDFALTYDVFAQLVDDLVDTLDHD